MSIAAGIRSEFLNIRSTPTARVLLVASMVMAPASLVANLSAIATDELATRATVELAIHASTVATVVFALVAGVVGSTSDYRFGRIDQLLLSQPRRWAVLAAKGAAGAVVGFVYGLCGAAVALAAVGIYYRAYDVPIDVASEVIVRPLLGLLLAAALFACFGVGLGTAVRNQPVALGGALALLLIVQPTVLLGLPAVGKWFPGSAALSLTETPDPELFGQAGGAVLLLAWTAVALVVAGRRLSVHNA